jgi:myo-inositol-1(or 4)-monophosphatase
LTEVDRGDGDRGKDALTDLAAELDLARAAAREAGAVVMQYFGSRLEVTFKEPGQPLTEADLAADRLLRERLTVRRPGYGWLSEESIDSPDRLGRQRVWIVDPIDGTRSFIAGRPEFTISIGLAHEGEVVAGVVYNPALDELYSATLGGGVHVELGGRSAVALRLMEHAGDDVNAATSPRTILASRTEIGDGEFAGFGEEWRVEPVGSTAYKLARVAAGRGDVFLSRGPKSEWDICAGVLLVREAGGRVTDVLGGPPRFNGADPYVHGIIAAGVALHGAVLRQIGDLRPTERLRRVEE